MRPEFAMGQRKSVDAYPEEAMRREEAGVGVEESDFKLLPPPPTLSTNSRRIPAPESPKAYPRVSHSPSRSVTLRLGGVRCHPGTHTHTRTPRSHTHGHQAPSSPTDTLSVQTLSSKLEPTSLSYKLRPNSLTLSGSELHTLTPA